MRILFLTRFYFPHIGGVEIPVKNLSETLIKKGHQVTIITEKFDQKLKSRETVNGVKVIRFSYPRVRVFGLIYIWFWLLWHSRYFCINELIHCHDVFVWYLPFRFLFLRKPVYTTFHGWEGTYPVPYKNILLKKIASSLSRGTLAVGNYIGKYYGTKSDQVTYGALDTSLLYSNEVKDKRRILYLGRLEKDTGLLIFLKTLKMLKGFQVDFCGDGPFRNNCETVGKVHGFVDPLPYLKSAEICFASGYYSILEALGQKCLVFGAYDNPLKKDYFLMAPFAEWIEISNSPRFLAKKVRFFSSHESEAKEKTEKAHAWAKKQTWQKLTDMYLKLWGLK